MHVDVSELESHRTALTGHCYRMLGSSADADDAVQETMVRAWRNLERYEGRASLRTWMYRIATNVCLDTLSSESRRMRPFEDGPASLVEAAVLNTKDRTHWLEPIPDARAIPEEGTPFEQAVLRQSVRLAFVAALQHLPPRQRAVLLFMEVLGWSAAETAECLDMTVAAVNSGLQRARATMASRNATLLREPEQVLTDEQSSLLTRYVDAFHRYDVEGLVSLLRDDATFSMPPYALWLQGPDSVRGWLTGPGLPCRGSKLVPVAACASPAFAQYRLVDGKHTPWALVVLELDGDRIAGWNSFLDTETLFPMFGLPMEL
jgi:RNA polymerase sigma-70 factor (ECF subfamily)